MASKDNDIESDGLDDFDFGDLDTGIDPEPDDRSPVRKLSGSFVSGVMDDMKDKQNMKRRLTDSLPKGYGKAINLADDVSGEAKDLYNTVVRESSGGVRDFKRASQHVLRRHEEKIPKGVLDRLKSLVETDDKERRVSTDEIRDQEITGNLASIFETTLEVEKQEREKDRSENVVRDQAEEGRHRTLLEQLDAIREAANRQVSYQDSITARYQRKSLELQYRQYFVSRDLYNVSEASFKDTKEALQGIVKNTGLPEYRKTELSEAGGQMLRDKFLSGAQSRLGDYMSNFFGNFRENLTSTVKERARGVGDTLSMAAGQMEMMRDAQEMGADVDATSMAGQMAGSTANDFLMKRLTPHLQRYARDNSTIASIGERLDHAVNLPRQANEWARSDTQRTGVMGYVERFFKDLVPKYEQKSEVADVPLLGADEHVPFTSLTRRSITEIIPGFLSRIHQELRILRTGDESTGRLTYNLDRGEFTSVTRATADVAKRIFNPNELQRSGDAINNFVESAGLDEGLSPEARQHALNAMMKQSSSGLMFRPNDFANEGFYSEEVPEEYRREIAAHFRDYFAIDEEGNLPTDETNSRRVNRAGRRFNALGTDVTDPFEQIRGYLETGQRESLAELGLIDRKGSVDRINYQHIWKILQDGKFDYEDPQGPDGGLSSPSDIGSILGRGGAASIGLAGVGRDIIPRLDTGATSPGGRKEDLGRVETRLQELITNQQDHSRKLLESLDVIRSHYEEGSSGDNSQGELLEAIKQNNTRDLGEHRNELLERILEKLETGVGGGRFADGSVGDYVNRARGLAGRAGRGLMNYYGKVFSGAGSLIGGAGKLGGSILSSAGSMIRKKGDQLKDVYVKGSYRPALRAKLLQAGEYRDQVTGKVIEKLDDIKELKGPIVDRAGNVILSLEEAAKGIFTEDRSWSFSKGWDMVTNFYGKLFSPLSTLRDGARATFRMARDYVQRVKDVYVKGEQQPRLLAVVMKNGGYISAHSKKVINNIKDIDGDVLDRQGNVVLSLNDMRRGLVDVRGRSLQFFKRILQRAQSLVDIPKRAIGWGLKKGKAMANFGIEAFGKLFSGIGDSFNSGKVAEVSEKSHDVLVEIRDLLKARLPEEKNRWDNTGDGFRDGSWQAQLAANDDDGGDDDKDKDDDKSPGVLDKIGGFFSGLLGRFMPGGGDGGGDTNIDIWGDPRGNKEGRGNRGGNRNRRRPRGRIGRMWDATKRLGRGARNQGGRVASWLGRQGAVRGAMTGATALAGKVGLGGALAKGGAALATGAAAVAGAPLWAVGAAVVGVGALGYFAYRRLSRREMGPLQKLRFLQYGVREDEKDQVSKVLYLEDTLAPHVAFSDGEATLEAPNLDVQKLMTDFGVDINDAQHTYQFEQWMINRFLPIFLAHKAALKQVSSTTKLKDVDKELDRGEKREYLELLRNNYRENQEPYSIMASPFNGSGNLSVRASEVEEYFSEVESDLQEEERERSSRRASRSMLGADLSTENLRGITESSSQSEGLEIDRDPDMTRSSRGVTSLERPDVLAGGSFVPLVRDRSTVQALEAVRLRVYGLIELTEAKVSILRRMEEEMLEDVTFTTEGDAEFEGNSRNLAFRYAGYFGIRPHNNRARRRWLEWFQSRYLPTYLTYLSALYAVNHNLDAAKTQMMNDPAKVLELAEKLANLTVEHGDEIVSIWEVDANPFGDIEINTDSSTVEANIDVLKERVEERSLHEERNNVNEEDQVSYRLRDRENETRQQQDTQQRQPQQATGGSQRDTGSQSSATTTAANNGRDISSGGGSEPYTTGASAGHSRRTLPSGRGYRKVAAALIDAGITDPEEQAMALAQLGHESGGFTQLEENLNYSADALLRVFGRYFSNRAEAERFARNPEAIANRTYGGRMGNRDPGDGWKYRGRGFIQLTGRDNYEMVSQALGHDYVNNPDLLLEPEHAARASLWWWKNRRGLRPAAQQGDVRTSTRLINGGYNGLPDRQSRYQQYLPAAQGGEITRVGASEASSRTGESPLDPMDETAVEGATGTEVSDGGERNRTSRSIAQARHERSGGQSATPSGSGEGEDSDDKAVSSRDIGPRSTISVPSIDNTEAITQSTTRSDEEVALARRRQLAEADARDQQGREQNEEMARSMSGVENILRESLGYQTSIDDRLRQVLEIMRSARSNTDSPTEGQQGQPTPPSGESGRRPQRQVADAPEGAVDLSRRTA